MGANDQNTFFLLGEQVKGSTNEATNNIALGQLRTYLRNLPSLSLSDKGQANVCQRFKVSSEELAAILATLQRPSAPSNALLSIIGSAVTHTSKGKGGPGQC